MNRLKTKNITYIFGSGRKEKLLSNEEFPKEFFYSYFDIADKVLELDFIEFNDTIEIDSKIDIDIVDKNEDGGDINLINYSISSESFNLPDEIEIENM